MAMPLTQLYIPPTTTKVLKAKRVDGNINNANVVIVYGDVKGNIYDCDTVIVINGDVNGNITLCDNVAGFLSDKATRAGTAKDILY